MNLLLLTRDYPFGLGESFIRDEIEQLCQSDFKLYLLPFSHEGKKRSLPKELTLLEKVSFVGFIINLPSFILKYGSIMFKDLFYELRGEKLKILLPSRFIFIFAYWIRSIKLIIFLEKECLLDPKKTLFYSYWMNSESYGLSLFARKHPNKNLRFVSRVHGGDLYLERNHGYLPFRNIIFNSISSVFSISFAGKLYINEIYGDQTADKVFISRLGVKKSFNYRPKDKENSSIIKLVSCSSDVSIKRVGLILEIIKELSCRSERRINWFHVGIKKDSFNHKYNISNDKITNLKIVPLGMMSNEELIEKYKEISPDIFINYSSTEGIPVSIMEALSCAIPVFATDVGGTSEIVDSSVGRLVDPNSSIEDTVDELIKLINDLDKEPLQRNAYLRWKESCNATKNYSQHAKFLESNLIKS